MHFVSDLLVYPDCYLQLGQHNNLMNKNKVTKECLTMKIISNKENPQKSHEIFPLANRN